MAIYQVGFNESSETTTPLEDVSVSASGGLSAGSHTQTATATTAWNVAGYNSLTLTWQNDMSVGYWTSPAGSYSNYTRYCYLVFADYTELLLGTGTEQVTQTVDLSQYTDSQKASVKLMGKLDYYLSTVTNSSNYGGISATNVVASASTSGGALFTEIEKLYVSNGASYDQIAKVYDWNGTAASLIYSAETNLGTLGPFGQYWCLNVGAYKKTATKTSDTYLDIAGYTSLTIDWMTSMLNGYGHANGNSATGKVYAKFEDGSTILLGSKTSTIYAGGDTRENSGTTIVDCTGKTKLYLYVTLSTPTGGGGTSSDTNHMYLDGAFTQVIGS